MICIRYSKEERVLNDVIDLQREAGMYQREMRRKIVDQVYFKIVLDMCEFRKEQYEKFMEMNESQREKILSKKQY